MPENEGVSDKVKARILEASVERKVHRSKLEFATYNPRQMNRTAFQGLCASIRKHGLVDPPVWNERTGRLVGGHHRVKALDHVLGTTDYELSVRVVNVDELAEKAMNIALNNPEIQGQFDLEFLGDVMRELRDGGHDLRETGFGEFSLQTMFGDEFAPVAQAQVENEAPSVELLAEMREVGVESEKARRLPEDSKPLVPPRVVPTENPLAARRKEFVETRTREHDQADTYVVFVFDRSEQIPPLLRALGVEASERYHNAKVLADALGIELE